MSSASPSKLPKDMSSRQRADLRQKLTKYLSEEELRILCFDLNVDYESLYPEGKAGKVVELIVKLERTGRIPELVEQGRKLYPHVSWNELVDQDEPSQRPGREAVSEGQVSALSSPVKPSANRLSKTRLVLLAGGFMVIVVMLATVFVLISRGGVTSISATPTALGIARAEPTSTSQLVRPTATLPGVVVVSPDKLASTNPWLALDRQAIPTTMYIGFNIRKAPFDNLRIREAFAAAVDRKALAQLAAEVGFKNAKPATTLTPAESLGRDLYGQMGIPFDPSRAQLLLAQTGYPNGQGFPAVTLTTNGGEGSPNSKIMNSVAEMWQKYLKVNAGVELVSGNIYAYTDALKNNSPLLYRFAWAADANDPDDFLKRLALSHAEYNYGRFANAEFDEIVEQAAQLNDPTQRQILYIRAEQILCQEEIALIPLFHFSSQ